MSLIRTIIIDTRRSKNNSEVLEELDLSVLNLLIEEDDEMEGDFKSNTIEKEKKLTELMKLYHELIKTPAIRTKVLENFTVSKMRILLKPVLEGHNESGLSENPFNLFYVSLY